MSESAGLTGYVHIASSGQRYQDNSSLSKVLRAISRVSRFGGFPFG